MCCWICRRARKCLQSAARDCVEEREKSRQFESPTFRIRRAHVPRRSRDCTSRRHVVFSHRAARSTPPLRDARLWIVQLKGLRFIVMSSDEETSRTEGLSTAISGLSQRSGSPDSAKARDENKENSGVQGSILQLLNDIANYTYCLASARMFVARMPANMV